jgi:hypothetical protein
MNYDQLARGYDPRDRIEEGYAYNPAQQQERFHPKAILGADVKQRQQGGVTREMQQFEKNLHALASVIDSLDSRLASACIPANETSPGLRGTEGSGCSLANQLSAFNAMLSCQINRIEMIYQGVDL